LAKLQVQPFATLAQSSIVISSSLLWVFWLKFLVRNSGFVNFEFNINLIDGCANQTNVLNPGSNRLVKMVEKMGLGS
jgi:hypothetical protein